MFDATRRMMDIFLGLMAASAVATAVFLGIAFHNAGTGHSIQAASAGGLTASIVLLAALALYVWMGIRLRKQSYSLDSMLQLITPLGESLEESENQFRSRQIPKSIHHLLQSLDVQRKIMKQTFEHAPFGVLMIGKNQTIAYANTLFRQLTGYAPDDLSQFHGDNFRSLLVTEPEGTSLLGLLAETQGTGQSIFSYLRQKDGTLLPSLVTGFALSFDQAPGTDSFLLFIRDISPTHQLENLQQQYAFLLNSLNLGVIVTDLNFRVSYANHAFCDLFALEPQQVLGQPLEGIAYEDSVEPFSISRRMSDLTVETGENQSREIVLPLPSGKFRYIQVSTTPIKDLSSACIGVLTLYQDRTADKEVQDTMRRHDQLETVSQMAASIAHEVRNPMTSVQGFLQLMSKEIDPSHTHSMYLHVMEEDLKRINSIITEYLNFSRMGSGALEDVWVGTLLHNLYTLLQSEANLRSIQIDLVLQGNNPLLIADPHGLKQVLINLARNAMEAMRENGGGTLTLALETTEDDVCVMVKDTGPGIPPEHLSNIFNPYYTTKKTGTGLGLFISKKIISEHNGTLSVQSEAGRGTTFSILLPRNRL